MAQGKNLKKKLIIAAKPKGSGGSAAKAKSHGSSVGAPLRKGRVEKTTKKKDVAKHNKLQKKLAANMTASLEQAMAVKAGAVGKLTIMREAQTKGKTVEVKKRKY
ncbi:hypothetical protein FBU31_006502 [Coemansia sp. 'formosensis']|uniref:Uncharacterized protein n=1 Tax=Coemansia furcata TaxID=417177 RepID=A0ACC1LH55_9FUNG|nr:hypothetical protein H4S07_003573 [Coemansia furcata]KAJ2816649.1 hypothetical protein FBU31_006502 [Coemansia sp. 'formosensis']